MADDEQTKAVSQDKIEQAVDSSIQSRAHETNGAFFGVGAPGLNRLLFYRQKSDLDIPPYGYGGRATALRRVWRLVGADIIASAIAVMIQKVQATGYAIDGPQRTVSQAQQMIDLSELGAGWLQFVAKWVIDFCTQDNGAFTELQGPGKPLRRGGAMVTNPDGTPVIDVAEPMVGKPISFSHFDSIACERTGVFRLPVRYYDINGSMHLIHRSRVYYVADMPQPDERLFGYGFSALSRCISTVQYSVNWAQMRNESLDNMPPLNIATLENVNKEGFEQQMAAYEAELQSMNQLVLRSLMVLVQQDPTKPTAVKLTPIRQLWESFDEEKAFRFIVNTTSMAFGLDSQELAPLVSASMGMGQQSSVLDEKARGKGYGNILTQLEAFMRNIMPASCTFYFDRRNDGQDLQAAQIRDTKAKTVIALYTGSPGASRATTGAPGEVGPSPLTIFLPGTDSPTATSLIDRDEARRLLLLEVPEWAEVIDPDMTLRQEVTVDELDPALADMQTKMYGPKVRYISKSHKTLLLDTPKSHVVQKNHVPVSPVTQGEIAAARKRLAAIGIDVEALRPKEEPANA